MASEPWKDWIPGVLSPKQLQELIHNKKIRGIANPDGINEPSIDLSLSSEAYKMPRGSVKPMGGGYLATIENKGLGEKYEPDEDGNFLLQQWKTYVFKLKQSLAIDNRDPIYGKATARSTIGRVDVLARLIVDGARGYEEFKPSDIAAGGDMFLEITPMTFDVQVRENIAISQLL